MAPVSFRVGFDGVCWASATLICSGLLASVMAQHRQEPLRRAVDMVAVDFVAIDKHGEPVAGLRPDEVVIAVDGVPRKLSSLDFVKIFQGAASASPLNAIKAEGASGADGAIVHRRNIILVFAHESIRPGNERPVIHGVGQFLSTLSPDDRVGLITIPAGMIEVDLTTDRAVLRAGLHRVVGHSPDAVPMAGRRELLALTEILDGLANIPGRKTVILVTEGLTPRMNRRRRDAPDTADIQRVESAAFASQSEVLILQPHNLPIDAVQRRSGSFSMQDEYSTMNDATTGLEDLAGATGGRLFRLSGAATEVFARIRRETSAYYLASFPVEESDRTGKERVLTVRVTRRGVTVRARRSFRVQPVG